ncbi:hypothetical protein GUITHDRAFT_148091 [Guillardia theta CCMP2712]|uniref:Uncharacterized protein n=2 Tax=Guillardia theta TaxID=55529 RepID=L1IAC3_GUITC|nr:hypothetical protein GUITHDRAFT_148091 [Guillardia theta CCMP2712]EKX33183.1 hypothetical protein GUITHDRAFT_148091 [Guillardia theta CCMP2712]|eukprot:XP_005820163.1 hypothetical protein GUITHDRAFT_148091 [Guillardia theta CCMP2712]
MAMEASLQTANVLIEDAEQDKNILLWAREEPSEAFGGEALDDGKALVGLRADPASENWEDDFDFDSPSCDAFPAPPQADRLKSKSKLKAHNQSSLGAPERNNLEELLKVLPDLSIDANCLDDLCRLFSSSNSGLFTVKTLLKDVQSMYNSFHDKYVVEKFNGKSRTRIEDLEQNLTDAMESKCLQAELSACLELARTYRAKSQQGAAMLKLQRAQTALQTAEQNLTGEEGSEASGELITEAHILHEMAITARKIQDLNAAKAYLERAFFSISSSKSLSPLWSPLWLRLHVDSGILALSLGSTKTALWHFSQYLAGLVARQPSLSVDTLVKYDSNDQTVKYYEELFMGCFFVGATLQCSMAPDLALTFIKYSIATYKFMEMQKIENAPRKLKVVICWYKEAMYTSQATHDCPSVNEDDSLYLSEDEENADVDFDEQMDDFGSNEGKQNEDQAEKSVEEDDEFDEEDEDWDRELEIEAMLRGETSESISRESSRSSLFTGSRASENIEMGLGQSGDSLPERWVFSKTLSGKSVKPVIIMYPKVSPLYSIRSKRIMSEAATQQWLEGLIKSQRQSYLLHSQAANYEGIDERLKNAERSLRDWTILCVQYCHVLFRLPDASQHFWKYADIFFRGVAESKLMQRERDWKTTEAEDKLVWLAVMRACESVTLMASQLWTSSSKNDFLRFLKISREVSRRKNDYFYDVMELETFAHHRSSEMFSSVIPGFCRIFLSAIRRERDEPPSNADADTTVIEWGGEARQLEDWGRLEKGNLSSGEMGWTSFEAQAAALADIQLCLKGRSPITAREVVHDMKGHKQENPVEWQDGDVDMPDMVSLDRLLLDEEYRISLLADIYPKTRPDLFLRAKCAFVLGNFYLQQKEGAGRVKAEQLLLESLYILDNCAQPVPGIKFLVSSLGEVVLQAYAAVLLENNKYKYGVLALEAAAECQKLRTGVEPQQLYRQLAMVCTEHGDYERSLRYYSIVLGKARQDGKSNEFIFVSERVSDILVEHGDFAQAEQILLAAIAFLQEERKDKKDSSSLEGLLNAANDMELEYLASYKNLDTRFLRILMKLSKIHLDGYETVKGVRILKKLLSRSLPASKKASIQALLATGHYELWQTAECDACLASAAAATSSGFAEVLSGPELFAITLLGCKNLLRSGRAVEALKKIDEAIAGETRLSGIGQLFLLRGKVLQTLACRSEGDASVLPSFSSTLDLWRGAAESMHMAMDAFSRVGDRSMESKAACCYAQVRLDAIWCPCVLLKKQWETTLFKTAPKDFVSRSALHSPMLGPGMRRRETKSSMGSSGNMNTRMSAASRASSMGSSTSPHLNAIDSDPLCSIERASIFGLEENAATLSDIMTLLRSHLNMAEIRWLQGRRSAAMAHFLECRDLFFGLFVSPAGNVLVSDGPLAFTRAILGILNRMARFVLVWDKVTINHHIAIFDTILNLEVDLGFSSSHGMEEGRASENGRRVWSLLHSMRCIGRLGNNRRLSKEDVQRRNLNTLRKIWRVCTSSATVITASMRADAGQLEQAGRSPSMKPLPLRPPPPPCNVLNLCLDSDLVSRHIYILCLMEQFLAIYSPYAGLLEARILGTGDSGGMFDQTSLAVIGDFVQGLSSRRELGGQAMGGSEDPAKKDAANQLQRSEPLKSCELGKILLNSFNQFPADWKYGSQAAKLKQGQPGEATQGCSRTAKRKRSWLKRGCFMMFKSLQTATKHKEEEAIVLPPPLFIACSALLRAIPWEIVCQGFTVMRSLGLHPFLRCDVAKEEKREEEKVGRQGSTQAEERSQGMCLVIPHKSNWRKQDSNFFERKKGALGRNWLTAMQQRQWAPPWDGGAGGGAGGAGGAGDGPDRHNAFGSLFMHAPIAQPSRKISQLRRKYRLPPSLQAHVVFVESEKIAASPQEFAVSVDKEARGREVFFLLPYFELLRFASVLSDALAMKGGCTLIFCPDYAIKQFVTTLQKNLQERKDGKLCVSKKNEQQQELVTEYQKIVQITAQDIMKRLDLPVALLSTSMLAPIVSARKDVGNPVVHSSPTLPAPPSTSPPAAPKVKAGGEEEGGRREEQREAAAVAQAAPEGRKWAEGEDERMGNAEKEVENRRLDHTKVADVIAKFRESSETLEETDEETERPLGEDAVSELLVQDRNFDAASNNEMEESDDDTRRSSMLEEQGEAGRIDNVESPALNSMTDFDGMQDTQDGSDKRDDGSSKTMVVEDADEVVEEKEEEEEGGEDGEGTEKDGQIELFGPDENPNSPVQTNLSKSELHTSDDGFVHSPIEVVK